MNQTLKVRAHKHNNNGVGGLVDNEWEECI